MILVTGATGFIGSAVADHFAARGRAVRRAGRSLGAGADVAVGEIGPDTDWSEALTGVSAVVHCAARAHVLKEQEADPLTLFRRINTQGTVALARQAAAAGVRRLVFVSSIGVNGTETSGQPFRASDVPAPHSPYAVSKYEAEHALAAIAAETGLEIVVVRPPLVVGLGAKGNLAMLTRAMRKGIPLPFGLVTRNCRDFVSLDNLASLLFACLDQPGAIGEPLLAGDGKAISTRGLIEWLARIEGLSPRLIPVPPILLSLALRVLGRHSLRSQLLGNLEVDIDPTVSRVGDFLTDQPALSNPG